MTINDYTTAVLQYENLSEDELFSRILEGFRKYSDESVEPLKRAYEIGKKIHAGQKRESGAPYFTHPLSVALILLPYQPDRNTLLSCILHDVFEESASATIKDDIYAEFGQEVVDLIEGVSKVGQKSVTSLKFDPTKETIRKMLSYAEKDVRIVLIKIADRLHNTITLGSKKDPLKKSKKAKQTLAIFVPIAARLGIWEIKRQLEDNCFYHLEEEKFNLVKQKIEENKPSISKLFNYIKQELKGKISSSQLIEIETYMSGIYTSANRFKIQNSLNPEDIFYVKLIVKTEEDCYNILAKLNHIFPRRNEEFKDFIASPKDNGYRAIHVTMIVKDIHPIRFHISSVEMEERNYRGIVLDIGKKIYRQSFLKELEMIDTATKQQSESFIRAIQSDILEEKIAIHHKGGKKTYIPKRSSALDAVFFLFPEDALRTTEIFVNNKKINPGSHLTDNDTIKATFANNNTAKIEWLAYLETEGARIKLHNYLRKLNYRRKIELGQKLLQDEFDRFGAGEVVTKLTHHKSILEKLNLSSVEEIFILIAEGLLTPPEALNLVIEGDRGYGRKGLIDYLFPVRKRDSSLRLKIAARDITSHSIQNLIATLCQKHNAQLQKISIIEKENKNIQARLTLKSAEKKDLDGFFLELQKQENISKMTALTSPALLLQLSLTLLFAAFTWFFFLYLLSFAIRSGNPSFSVYALIIPVLIGNFTVYRFISDYFSFIRNSRWFVVTAFAINAIAISLYAAMVVIHQLDFLKLSVFFPLTILVLSSLAIIYVFLQRHAIYSIALDLKPLTREQWRKRKRQKLIGYLIRLGAVIIWGIEPLYIKYTPMNTVDPGLRVFLKGIGGLIPSIIVGFLIIKLIQRQSLKIKLPYNYLFVLLIIGEIAFTYLINSSLLYTSSTNVILLNNFAPVIALILAALLWRDKIPYLKKNIHVAIIFSTFVIGSLGSTFLFYNDIKFATDANLKGNFLAVLTMLSDVLLVISMIKYIQSLKVNQSVALNFNIFLFSLIFTAPFVLFAPHNLFQLTQPQIVYSIGAGVLSGVGRILNFEAFRRIDGFLAYLMFNISIFVTFVVEALILRSIPATSLLVLGGLMIIAASTVAEYINSRCEKQGL